MENKRSWNGNALEAQPPNNREIADWLNEIAALLDGQNANPFRVRAYRAAARIVSELGIETLAYLEAAAWNGRLARVPEFGPKRVRNVRESLAGRFQSRIATVPAPDPTESHAAEFTEPLIGELLDVD